jgi:pimeloyl-ACP methyl ester carboxylesterase
MPYTLDGITLETKRTPSGIGYFQYGTDDLPTIVYLHGIGGRGDGSEWSLPSLLGQGPLCRNWTNGGYTAWMFKDIFSMGFRILYPQLPTSKNSWDIAYIDSFLDAVHTNQPLFLCGWSLGGGGALRYAAQATKKHQLTCFAGFASAISPITGENVTNPYFFTHATNDNTVNVSHTDNYVAKIPNFNPTQYKRGTSGDHWYYLTEGFNTRPLYDWFKSLIQPVEELDGKIVYDGTDFYAVAGTVRRRIG